MKVVALKKKTVVYIVILIAVACLLAAAYVFLSRWADNLNAGNPEDPTSNEDGRIAINNEWYIPKEHLDSILLIGIDKTDDQVVEENNRNNRLADFNMLIVIDNENETYSAIQLNRDTMTNIYATDEEGQEINPVFGQLAMAHTYGQGSDDSCMNVVKTVSKLLMNMEIKHYASFTMDAVPVINDMVGGVTVTCLDDFSAFYPEMTEGSVVTLKGKQALTYIRARKSMSEPTNTARMERQRQYIAAFQEKLSGKVKVDNDFISKAYKTLTNDIVTDCTVNQLQRLYDKAQDYTFTGIFTPKGEAKVGEKYMEFTVDKDDLKQIIADVYFTAVKD
ncbi:MAG: LCP family protein [Clostridia bacterium]|nr:LCP family protein [Clostridia bacterium]